MEKKTVWPALAADLGLIALHTLLFSLSFPGLFVERGVFPLAWVSLVPLFLLVRRIGFVRSFLYGPLCGFAVYALHNYWLLSFNPLAFVVVTVIYAGWFALLLPALKLADRLFPRNGWLVQGLLFLAYEVLRTKGFVGYSYGILGYSQYPFLPLIGIADLGGVLPVSALVVFPSAFLSCLFHERKSLRIRRHLLPPVIWGLAFGAAVTYGSLARVDVSSSPRWRVALVQHNINAWLSGVPVYRKAFSSLRRLSLEAVKEEPDLIIWSETAFVPAVEWHERYRIERDKFELVSELRDFLASVEGPGFLIGGNDAVKEGGTRVDYNAALLFEGGKITGRYRKIHLVPFTEHFPYEKVFPVLARVIQASGVTWYGKGKDYTVFRSGEVRYSAMICYEDTFGYLSRRFVRAGAQVLVNLTNDAWSTESSCCYQHSAMAVFRAVENRRTLIRATTGGHTCVIDPNGRVTAELAPFTEAVLVADVPVWTGRTTLYTRWGNWFERLVLVGTLAVLVIGIVFNINRKRKSTGRKERES